MLSFPLAKSSFCPVIDTFQFIHDPYMPNVTVFYCKFFAILTIYDIDTFQFLC